MTPETMFVRTSDLISGNLWRCFPVINVDRVKDIPCDYPGMMGVPIGIMDKLNRSQFEVFDCPNHIRLMDGREPYRRVMIRNLRLKLPEEIDLVAWFSRMGIPVDVQFVDPNDMPEDAMPLFRGMAGGADHA